MTQSDLFLSNQPGASFRAELNQIIESLATNSAGTVAPSPTFPSQWFADYTANMMRRRRKDNTAWIDVSPIDEALLKATNAEVLAGIEATKAVTPATLKTVIGVSTNCRFDYVSSTICRLTRFNGFLLTIDNIAQPIPVSGVDLAPTGLLPATPLYYVYAYMNAGVMTLEASTTARAVDPRNGIQVKSGDATRTLVGQLIVSPGPVFDYTTTHRYVSSYYNRKPIVAYTFATGSTASASPVAVSGNIGFMAWIGEAISIGLSGSANCTIISNIYTAAYVDGATFMGANLTDPVATYNVNPGASAFMDFSVDGFHYVTLFGATANGGTATWNALAMVKSQG